MKVPTCPRCLTAAHLQLLDYDGLHRESRDQIGWGEMEIATPPHDVEPVADYVCAKCGHHDRHAVPRNWDPHSLRRAG